MKQPHHQRGREHDIYDRDDDEAATNGITTTGGDDGGLTTIHGTTVELWMHKGRNEQ